MLLIVVCYITLNYYIQIFYKIQLIVLIKQGYGGVIKAFTYI